MAVALLATAAVATGCDRLPWASAARTADAATVVVPEVVPIYPADAERRLAAAGLRVRYAGAPALLRVGPGTNGYAVRHQSLPAGTRVDEGSVVELTVGPSENGGGGLFSPDATGPVVVPDVVGRDVNAALSEVMIASLLATVEQTPGPLDSLRVVAQEPPAGTAAQAGDELFLRLR